CSNASAGVERVVESILEQTRQSIEVVLVENNSTDDTWDVVQRLAVADPRVRAHRIPSNVGEFGASVAVNVGVMVASNDLIIRMDDDTNMAPALVDHVARAFLAPDTVAVATNLRVENPTESIATRFQAIEYMFAMELNRGFQTLMGSVVCCSGGLSAYRRDSLIAAGGFCSSPRWVSEDLDMTLRSHRLGNVRMVSEAVGYTTVPVGFRALLRQRFRWGTTGMTSLYLHWRGIGRRSYWYDGRVGFFGLPMLALVKVRDLFAIGLPIAVVMAAVDGYGRLMVTAFAARAALLAVQMLVLTPVLRVRQGAWSYWLIAPFVVIYGPLVLAARCAGAWVGVRHIFELRRGTVAVARAGLGVAHRNPDVRRGQHAGHEERALRWGARAAALAGVM